MTKNTRMCIMLLVSMGLYTVPVYAHHFGTLFGTYQLDATEQTASGYETYTASVLIGRSRHYFDEYGFNVHPIPNRYVGGKIRVKKQHFELLYKSTGSNPHTYKTQLHRAFCKLKNTEARLARLDQTILDCTGNMRAKSNKGKFTLTKLIGKAETDLLQKLFDIKADNLKDEFNLVDKQSQMHVIFKKSQTNFLDVVIKHKQSTFSGMAKPSGKNRLVIRYQNTHGDTYLSDCSFALHKDTKVNHVNSKAVQWMRCEGTLSGLPNTNHSYSFKLNQ